MTNIEKYRAYEQTAKPGDIYRDYQYNNNYGTSNLGGIG